jgi:hypothetical protein
MVFLVPQRSNILLCSKASAFEAWKTILMERLDVLQAFRRSSVNVFFNISTDNATDPSSVLGNSKLLAGSRRRGRLCRAKEATFPSDLATC